MTFGQPFWLIIGAACCITLLVVLRLLKRKRLQKIQTFIAHQLIPSLTRNISPQKRLFKNILIISALFCCFIALARPQYGYEWVEVKRKGIDLLFAIDTSKSMLAEDIRPNRLKRAQLAILDFIEQLKGDRIGLMPFAGSSFLLCPLTLDYNAFEHSLSVVTPGIIPRGGTNLEELITQASNTLNNNANHKLLIILTDGENLDGDVLSAAKEAAEKGLVIYTVGVGTKQGELIPITTANNTSVKGFAKHRDGTFVTSRLNETMLTDIAKASGGIYAPLGPSGEGLESIYQNQLAKIPKKQLAERRYKKSLERFEYPLFIAIFLLMLELLIKDNKSSNSLFQKTLQPVRNLRSKASNNLLILLFLSPLLVFSHSLSYGSEGDEAYNKREYQTAAKLYLQELKNSPNDPILHYNYGTGSYKSNAYDEAISSFTKALQSEDLSLQEKAYFNKGNSHFRKGEVSIQNDPQKTIKQWQMALESFDATLKLSPKNEGARNNYLFVEKKLKELEQQQKQQNKQEQKDDKPNQDKPSEKKNKKEQKQEEKPENSRSKTSANSEKENKPNQEDNQKNSGEQQQISGNAKQKETDQNNVGEKYEQQEKAQAEELRKQIGKMTQEEAKQLLNALKNEEGELNFIPSSNSKDSPKVEKDW